jgi:hypothetical protein
MKKSGFIFWVAACALAIVIFVSGCGTMMSSYNDRKRALAYLPPEHYYPYSKALAAELGYSELWSLPLSDTVNLDVSDMSIATVDAGSIVVSAKEDTIDGARRAHFLVRGIDAGSPKVIKRTLAGNIVTVNGKLFVIEEKNGGAIVSFCDDQMNVTSRKNIVLDSFTKLARNNLGAENTGNYYLEDNTLSTYILYPYIILVSVNFKTDQYYKYTHYQSEAVKYNSVEIVCINVQTGDTVEATETDFSQVYRKFFGSQGRVCGPSGFFDIVDKGASLVFSLTDREGNYINGYFDLKSDYRNSILFDTTENLVKRFPTLVQGAHVEKTKEQLVMENSIKNQTAITLAMTDVVVTGYVNAGKGYLVFGKAVEGADWARALYYVDSKLNRLFWKRAFAQGVNANSGNLTQDGTGFYFPDIDVTGKGMIVVKSLETGKEAKLLPVDLYEGKAGLVWQYFPIGDSRFIVYDDERGALVCFNSNR